MPAWFSPKRILYAPHFVDHHETACVAALLLPGRLRPEFKDKQSLVIPPKSVTLLSYRQEAHRRVGTMVALAILVAPVALFGLFHKTRLHYIGIQYSTPDTKHAGILLQGDKDNYRAMLVALPGLRGAPVAVGEKERGFIPVGLTTAVAKDSGENKSDGAAKRSGGCKMQWRSSLS